MSTEFCVASGMTNSTRDFYCRLRGVAVGCLIFYTQEVNDDDGGKDVLLAVVPFHDVFDQIMQLDIEII